MFTYTENGKLYVLNIITGNLFQIRMGCDNYPEIVLDTSYQYGADILRLIEEKKAVKLH